MPDDYEISTALNEVKGMIVGMTPKQIELTKTQVRRILEMLEMIE